LTKDTETSKKATQFNQDELFKDERYKDDIEHKFNFGDKDMDKFTESVQAQYDEKMQKKSQG